MRKWHRWLSLFFGVFLLWIAATGVLSQVVPLLERGSTEAGAGDRGAPGGPAPGAAASAPTPGAPAGFVCPETMTCRPRSRGGGGASIVGTLHHLHSGESFGPVGVVITTLSGVALLFFAFSGLWMYVQLWRGRASRDLKPRWLW